MQSKIDAIIQRIPEWQHADDLHVDPLEGLTNTNYAVTVDGERYVLRISGPNADILSINREHELEVLSAVSKAGIGAKVAHYLLPEGHLVTQYIKGHHLEMEDYCNPANIRRIVKTLKKLHALPVMQPTFSPFKRVERYAEFARSKQVPLPHDFDVMLAKAETIKAEQAQDPTSWRRFCHNDLFCVNVMDDGKIRFIDWEFAGVNDVYFDLATLTYAYDSLDTLSYDLQDYLLRCYFGKVTEAHWSRLEGMQYMLLFFTAMWGLVQQGMLNDGRIQAVEGFDFLEYAEETFETMRRLA